ncbi:MAG: TIGR04076 family protein [Promethearchaeota archaeon]
MPTYKVTIEVEDILGTGECSIGQKVGNKYRYPEDFGKMCPWSFYILYPTILVMLSGGSFAYYDDDGASTTLGCSDHKHQVVYRIRREIVEDE